MDELSVILDTVAVAEAVTLQAYHWYKLNVLHNKPHRDTSWAEIVATLKWEGAAVVSDEKTRHDAPADGRHVASKGRWGPSAGTQQNAPPRPRCVPLLP